MLIVFVSYSFLCIIPLLCLGVWRDAATFYLSNGFGRDGVLDFRRPVRRAEGRRLILLLTGCGLTR